MEIKNELERLLIEAWIESGLPRKNALRKCIDYVQKTDHERLKREIKQITSHNLLRMLSACGITADLEPIFLDQYQKYSKKAIA